jgi:hypothetical protein
MESSFFDVCKYMAFIREEESDTVINPPNENDAALAALFFRRLIQLILLNDW